MPDPDALTLTPFDAAPRDDLRALLAIRNENAVRHNMYHSDPIDPATHERWLDRIIADPSAAYFLAHLGPRLAGMVGFSSIDRGHGRADWAFYATGALQGMGLGKRMETAALALAFGDLGLNKLNCEVIAWNEGVIGLHKRFGFTEEGRRRQHVFRDGVYHDAVLLGLTREEWAAGDTA